MNGQKIALTAALVISPVLALAVEPLSEQEMGGTYGQAGLSIEAASKLSIGEVAYQDRGFIAISDIKLGGATNDSALDNLLITVDIAGDGSDLAPGELGQAHFADVVNPAFVRDIPEDNLASQVSDGDLVIKLRRADNSQDWIDFGLSIGNISLAASSEQNYLGDLANHDGTQLISNLDITGDIGLVDLIVKGNENKVYINTYFSANGQLNMPFVGTSMGFELHNRRGASRMTPATASTTSSTGRASFAHLQSEVGSATNAAGQDALSLNLRDFSGDLDLNNITMGTAPSIGDVYMTDISISANKVVYGH